MSKVSQQKRVRHIISHLLRPKSDAFYFRIANCFSKSALSVFYSCRIMAASSPHYVVFNISGQRFTTTVSSMNVESESRLAQIVREHLRYHQPNNKAAAVVKGVNGFVQREEIFLCRDPSVFQFVVNYLRNGSRATLPLVADHETLARLMKEAEYYQLHGLIPLIWRTMRGIPLILPPLQVEQEVCWNPGTLSLYWQSVAVMTQCYAPRRAHYQVIGLMKSAYQLTNESIWWCYDVRCPACSSFDFAPVEDGVEFAAVETPTKAAMRASRGKVRKVCDHTCALVDFDQGWRFHVPVSALLPSAMTALM